MVNGLRFEARRTPSERISGSAPNFSGCLKETLNPPNGVMTQTHNERGWETLIGSLAQSAGCAAANKKRGLRSVAWRQKTDITVSRGMAKIASALMVQTIPTAITIKTKNRKSYFGSQAPYFRVKITSRG